MSGMGRKEPGNGTKIARRLLEDSVAPVLRAISAQLDSADKFSSQRHAAVMEKLETTRRKLTLKLELALVTRKLEDLQSKQQESSPH